MVRRVALASLVLAVSAPALAGDRGDCRQARRRMTVESWTAYVLDHPGGRCQDEALGQLIVLSVGRVAGQAAGDPTKLALGLAQLSRTSSGELSGLASMLGGGFGGLGAVGLGDPGLYSSGDTSGLYAGLGAEEPRIYVSYYPDHVDGSWNEDQFRAALDGARPALESCWAGLGRGPMGVYYVARFEVADGKVSVKALDQTYSDDGVRHEEIEGCVRSSLEAATFPAEVAGTYSYRVELY